MKFSVFKVALLVSGVSFSLSSWAEGDGPTTTTGSPNRAFRESIDIGCGVSRTRMLNNNPEPKERYFLDIKESANSGSVSDERFFFNGEPAAVSLPVDQMPLREGQSYAVWPSADILPTKYVIYKDGKLTYFQQKLVGKDLVNFQLSFTVDPEMTRATKIVLAKAKQGKGYKVLFSGCVR